MENQRDRVADIIFFFMVIGEVLILAGNPILKAGFWFGGLISLTGLVMGITALIFLLFI